MDDQLFAAIAAHLRRDRRPTGAVPLDPAILRIREGYLVPRCRYCGGEIANGNGLFSVDELRLVRMCAACSLPFMAEER